MPHILDTPESFRSFATVALRQNAQRLGLEPEQLLAATIDDLIGQPDTDFDEAAKRVLAKNHELYQRLD